MDLERIVAILIHLLEDQENAKISYRIIPSEDENDKKDNIPTVVISDKYAGEMKDLKFIPTGKVYLTPGQRQARYIRMLERWVAALAVFCGILMILVFLLL